MIVNSFHFINFLAGAAAGKREYRLVEALWLLDFHSFNQIHGGCCEPWARLPVVFLTYCCSAANYIPCFLERPVFSPAWSVLCSERRLDPLLTLTDTFITGACWCCLVLWSKISQQSDSWTWPGSVTGICSFATIWFLPQNVDLFA